MSEAPAISAEEALGEIVALLERSEVEQAIGLARRALDQGLEAPLLLNLRAYWLENENRPADALVDLRRAAVLAPEDPAIANALGLCLAKLGHAGEAYAAFRRAAELAPQFGPAHFNCGWALEDMGEFNRARAAFEEAARLGPDQPDPLARLASLAARRGQWDDARHFAEQALALAPDHPGAAIALADADIAAKSYPAAKARLGVVMDSPRISAQDRATAIGLLGDVLDAQERYREAFAAYSGSNTLFKNVFAANPAVQQEIPMSQYVQGLADKFASETRWPKRSANFPSDAGPDRHVFLLGFPRSGTTLLEEVLACHPRVATTGERDALGGIVRDLFANPTQIDHLKTLDDGEIARHRTRYWLSLEAFGIPVEGRILIDKQPFNTIRLPLITRLFPDARILFCLRDPRDVVLSCFRRRFALNAANAEFLTLESAAGLYDAVMRLAGIYRDALPLSLIEIRNEDLVEDFDARIQAICDFAGIDWVDAFRDFANRSSTRQVATPSAAQIIRGLGRESIGHWRNYEADLAPVLPLLSGWATRLGYD